MTARHSKHVNWIRKYTIEKIFQTLYNVSDESSDILVDTIRENLKRYGGQHMSDKRLNNSIFLMYLVSKDYMKSRGLSVERFIELDEKYLILNYVAECPDIFDNMTSEEMVKEIDRYVGA